MAACSSSDDETSTPPSSGSAASSTGPDEPTTSTGTDADPSTATTSTSDVADPPEPAPRFFTADTPSGRYRLCVDRSATVQLDGIDEGPTIEGDAVLLIEIVAVTDGPAMWELRAVAQGDATVTVTVAGVDLAWHLVVDC